MIKPSKFNDRKKNTKEDIIIIIIIMMIIIIIIIIIIINLFLFIYIYRINKYYRQKMKKIYIYIITKITLL